MKVHISGLLPTFCMLFGLHAASHQTCLPRLAGFLVTSDDIPPYTEENKEPELDRRSSPGLDDGPGAFGPKKNTHSPPLLTQPPALYFLQAILTPAQKNFIDAQQVTVNEILAEEWKEWGGKFEEARKRDNEKLANPSPAPVAPTADEEMEVETENSVARWLDSGSRAAP
ncbi:hypothetical protein FRC04_008634 [Tulasnella sp. 424]|nr:hypothetical protein FRC04_008634 [Tulasnella sp. 424]KAG8970767.1 hypothetical protein FRC05_011718 [Tulasnella sp. 425]